jgi:hypothetical protein
VDDNAKSPAFICDNPSRFGPHRRIHHRPIDLGGPILAGRENLLRQTACRASRTVPAGPQAQKAAQSCENLDPWRIHRRGLTQCNAAGGGFTPVSIGKKRNFQLTFS